LGKIIGLGVGLKILYARHNIQEYPLTDHPCFGVDDPHQGSMIFFLKNTDFMMYQEWAYRLNVTHAPSRDDYLRNPWHYGPDVVWNILSPSELDGTGLIAGYFSKGVLMDFLQSFSVRSTYLDTTNGVKGVENACGPDGVLLGAAMPGDPAPHYAGNLPLPSSTTPSLHP
jgi:hypothetical protein